MGDRNNKYIQRTIDNQDVIKHSATDLNGWDCDGNNVSSGLCSSSVIEYIRSLGKQVIIDGVNVSIIDANN